MSDANPTDLYLRLLCVVVGILDEFDERLTNRLSICIRRDGKTMLSTRVQEAGRDRQTKRITSEQMAERDLQTGWIAGALPLYKHREVWQTTLIQRSRTAWEPRLFPFSAIRR
jgi:hypothetical protein